MKPSTDDIIGVRDPGVKAEVHSVALLEVLCDPIYDLGRRYSWPSSPSSSRRSRGPPTFFLKSTRLPRLAMERFDVHLTLAFRTREISLGTPKIERDCFDRILLYFNSRGSLKIRCKSARHDFAFAFVSPPFLLLSLLHTNISHGLRIVLESLNP